MNKKIATEVAIGIILIIAIAIGGLFWLKNKKLERMVINSCPTPPRTCADGTRINLGSPNCNQSCSEDLVACPQDAKLCPNGLSVGRTGPNCEFAACPPINDFPNKNCPQYAPPSPDWCPNDKILPGVKDANGCDGPPRCDISGSADWQTYTNDQYGFTLTFPDTWKGYTTKHRALDWGSDGTSDSIDFGFAAQDGLFNISFHTKKQYDALSSAGAPFGQKLGENKGYVIVWDQAQYAANADMEKRMAEVQSIIKTFKIIK